MCARGGPLNKISPPTILEEWFSSHKDVGAKIYILGPLKEEGKNLLRGKREF